MKPPSTAEQALLNPAAVPALDVPVAPSETAPEETPTFRFGDYEVGDGYFSELSGHPDIIY